MTSLNLNYLLKTLFPNIDSLEIRASTYEFGQVGGTVQATPLELNHLTTELVNPRALGMVEGSSRGRANELP